MASPNMNLTIPSPSVTNGPEWAQNVADDLSIIDAHDHTASNGVPIPSAGIAIDADLSMNEFNLIDLRTLRMEPQGSTPSSGTDLNIIYSKNGELAYRDASGNEVVITDNGSVAGAVGNITGLVPPASASYSSGTKTIGFNQDTSKPAKLAISDILLYEFNNASANPITIKAPASVTSPYSLTLLAALPAAAGLMVIDSTGDLSTVDADLGTNEQFAIRVNAAGDGFEVAQLNSAALAPNGVNFDRRTTREADATAATIGEVLRTANSGNFGTSSVTPLQVTNMIGSVDVGATGVVQIMVTPDDSVSEAYISADSTGGNKALIYLFRNGVAISQVAVSGQGLSTQSNPCLTFIDTTSSTGTNTYEIRMASSGGTGARMFNCCMVAYEI
jgi:hypothetical protein